MFSKLIFSLNVCTDCTWLYLWNFRNMWISHKMIWFCACGHFNKHISFIHLYPLGRSYTCEKYCLYLFVQLETKCTILHKALVSEASGFSYEAINYRGKKSFTNTHIQPLAPLGMDNSSLVFSPWPPGTLSIPSLVPSVSLKASLFTVTVLIGSVWFSYAVLVGILQHFRCPGNTQTSQDASQLHVPDNTEVVFCL